MDIKNKSKFGLSNENRNFIVTIVVIALLLFGPVEPYGIFIRFAYLIIIPVVTWFCLRHFGSRWKISEFSNNRLMRIITICIACVLLVGAYGSLTSKYHSECDEYANSIDGRECVGDYIIVKGPDKVGALFQIIIAGIAIYYAVSKKTNKG